ncbi:unnamed protein product [Soboliphyme baturini]|uniref:Mediator of RNA polymerase II transcription subunit 13 n=1 Tax=Soboliphyme baturini TaxID=241478 RepID=A0A183IHE7_9BILA|nr:unnamed protein product [Soboliphyme baturini]
MRPDEGVNDLRSLFVNKVLRNFDKVETCRHVLGFSFTFFVHGENNVCVSVSVQRQPPLYRLSRQHLTCKNGLLPVMLAPWCLNGVLKADADVKCDVDCQTEKLWREWSQFFPLPNTDATENMGYIDPVEKEQQDKQKAMSLPKMVDVLIGGVKMKYPSIFIAVADDETNLEDDQGRMRSESGVSNRGLAADEFRRLLSEHVIEDLSLEHHGDVVVAGPPCGTACDMQTAVASNPVATSTSNMVPADENIGAWNFIDLCEKESCLCKKMGGSLGSGNSAVGLSFPIPNKAQLKFGIASCTNGNDGKSSSEDKNGMNKAGGFFHRRFLNQGTSMTKTENSHECFTDCVTCGAPGVVQANISDSTSGAKDVPASTASFGLAGHSVFASLPVAAQGNGGALEGNGALGMVASAPTAMEHFQFSRDFEPFASSSGDRPKLTEYNRVKECAKPDELIVKPHFEGGEYANIDYELLRRKQSGMLTFDDAASELSSAATAKASLDQPNDLPPDEISEDFYDKLECVPSCNPPHDRRGRSISKRRKRLKLLSGVSGSQHLLHNATNVGFPFAPSPKFTAKDEPLDSPTPISGQSTTAMNVNDAVKGECDNGGFGGFPSSGAASLPDHITTGSGSDNDDETIDAFLSPPPSYSREEEMLAFCQKQTCPSDVTAKLGIKREPTILATSASCRLSALSASTQMPPQNGTTQSFSNGQQSYVAASVDHLGIIYPTPPSQESVQQFSPELSTHIMAVSNHHKDTDVKSLCDMPPSDRTAASGDTGGGSKRAASERDCDKQPLDSWSAIKRQNITDVPLSATYLSAPAFVSLPLSQLKHLSPSVAKVPMVYKPRKTHSTTSFGGPGAVPAMSHVLPFSNVIYGGVGAGAASLSSSGGTTGIGSMAHFGQHVNCRMLQAHSSCTGIGIGFDSPVRNNLSAPGSVRSINEQSPGSALNPPSVSSPHLTKTPKTPGMTDLASPLSNASSAYARNLSSIEPSSMPIACPPVECQSLVLNLLLCDSFINLQRDTIFDSCPLCVCNMNICGVEVGFYVAPSKKQDKGSLSTASHWTNKCTCGFSAVRNRYLSYMSGMFLEDEDDATDAAWNNATASAVAPAKTDFTKDIVELVRYQSLASDLTCSLLHFRPSWQALDAKAANRPPKYDVNAVELQDFSHLCQMALEQACIAMDCAVSNRSDAQLTTKPWLHRWGYLIADELSSSLETMSLLRVLLPILQVSVQKPRGLWQAKHSVEGPLTWRQLHRKCTHRPGSTGREDLSGPEPIPQLLVATDREWINVSPFSLRLWDRLSLEPYGHPKDVAYIAVVPDSRFVLLKASAFFQELSKMYQGMRLGRHCPITRVLKDGIMRVGNAFAKQLRSRLKLYAQVCRHYLAPQLCSPLGSAFDPSVFRDLSKESQSCSGNSGSGDSAMPPPPAPGSLPTQASTTSGMENMFNDSNLADASDTASGEDSTFPHVVVIYLVNPFNFGPNEQEDGLAQLVTTGLFRCYLEILRDVPEHLRGSMQLHIIPLQTVLDVSLPDEWERISIGKAKVQQPSLSQTDHLRTLALNVFTQIRSVGFSCLQNLQAKVLTGFGPAASRCELLKKKEKFSDFKVYSPAVVLAPVHDHRTSQLSGISAAVNENRDDHGQVLFLSYCLSSQQHWLLATVTDQYGLMLDSCVINLNVQERRNVVRREIIWNALSRLWDFIVGILASSCKPWRLVIGRLGRLGHEELKGWAHLLSKNHLKTTSKFLREKCSVCQPMPSVFETPAILSACLVSTELEVNLRVFPHSFVHDDRFGQGAKQCSLSSPDDVSCTHIMVFPTSALIQMNQNCVISGGLPGSDENDGDFDSLMEELMNGEEGGYLNDIFSSMGDSNLMNENPVTFDSAMHQNKVLSLPDTSDESIQLQPLALGFLVSTAPSGPLPDWFWTARPSAQYLLPVPLRSALHINTSGVQQSDDQLLPGGASRYNSGGCAHPLDSNLTTDVLRYVLETYNALSWLSLDMRTGDRLSCFPLHMQALSRLYRAMEAVIP